MTSVTYPEISGKSDYRTLDGPVTGGAGHQIVVNYSGSVFHGQAYARQATTRSDRDQLRVLSLLARIRESRLPDAPDDAQEAWEISESVASLTTAQWEAVEQAQESES